MAIPTKIAGGLKFHGWELTSHSKAHILESNDMDTYKGKMELPQMPEEVYAGNFLKLRFLGSPKFAPSEIVFNAWNALNEVDAKHDLVKVAYAKEWAGARDSSGKEYKILTPYDWTFTTPHKGKLDPRLQVSTTEERIDLESLKVKEPILHYDSINIYGDDFGDNGEVMLNVKVRAMPSSFFVLQRLFVRVDNVLVRIVDTRLYHRFGSDYLIREYSASENSVSNLAKLMHSNNNAANFKESQVDQFMPHLKEYESKIEKITFGPKSA
eukprot:m.121725 g.121725  ORF g.121725 m.121725 type:complete len:268 (+) comp28873_c0_seq1:207-1010(+)